MQIDLTLFTNLVGLGSLIIGIIASLLTLQRFTKDRKLGIFLEYNKLLYDKEFIQDLNDIQAWTWSDLNEFFSKYGPDPNPEAFAKYIRVINYFDGLSTLVQRRFMDYKFIPETTAIFLIRFWDKFQTYAEEFATIYRRPHCWDAIKTVFNHLQKTQQSDLEREYIQSLT